MNRLLVAFLLLLPGAARAAIDASPPAVSAPANAARAATDGSPPAADAPSGPHASPSPAASARAGSVVPSTTPEATVASPDPSAPATTRFAVYLRNRQTWVTDPRFDLVGERDTVPWVEVGAGYAPGWLGGDLAFEAGYAYGESSAPLFDVGDASLDLHSIQAAAVYRRRTSAGTQAFARGLLSLDLARLAIDDGEGTNLSDLEILWGLEGTLGWEVLVPLAPDRTADGRPARHLAVGVEAGYLFRPLEADFALDRDREGDDGPRPVARVPSDLGGMDLSGWVLRLGTAVRF